MDDFIARLPKAELHLHLEGTVGPRTLRRLAERHGTPLAAKGGEAGSEAIDRLYSTGTFSAFLDAFKTICQHLRSPEDYEFITYEALRQLAGQNVRYAELTLSAGVILWMGGSVAESFAGVAEGSRRALQDFGIRTAWIFDAVRQFGTEPATEVVRHAARLRDRGVVGFGIGGDERKAPPELFRDVFAGARGEGLRLSVHAGETAGPESVWGALEALGAERIGHGFTAGEDPALVDYLVEKQIPVEICLTSNLRTGCLDDLRHHPLRRYFDRGMAVVLNTDDPALFGTDLNREYSLAREIFGFTDEELAQLARASFRAAFLSSQDRDAYLADFSCE
jgi:aminodeoxyfutalosine deaminase